jgi:DNA repair protein SbcD/Mre11
MKADNVGHQRSASTGCKATRRLYVEAVNAARRRSGGKPLIVTGHLHCSGAIESEGAERRILVGGEHAVPPDVFAHDIAYVALGHLHKPQSIGRETIRYSGSPFSMSATEIPYDHGVSLVDLQPAGTHIEHVPLGRAVQCLRMPAAGSLTLAEVLDAIAALRLDAKCPTDLRPFVHIVVRPDGSVAGLAREVERALHEHPIRCAGVKVERPSRPEGELGEISAKSLVECDPGELFETAFTTLHGFAPNAQHRIAFESIRSGE